MRSKSSKKITIISIIVILIIAIGAVGGCFLYRYINLKSPIQEDWANIYYNYLKENKGNNKIKNNSKIGFMDVEDLETPVMAVEHEEDNKTYTDIFYIDNGEVQNINVTEPAYLVYVYNIQIKKYGWYAYSTNETYNLYTRILELILNDNSQNNQAENNIDVTEYKFENEDEISATTLDGEKISISEEDATFIDTDIKLGLVDYKDDMTEKELKDAIIDGVEKYKSEEELLTDELKENVSNQEKQVIQVQEEIKDAEKKVEEIKINQSNLISKIGEHLKYFTGCYRGSNYGIYDLFDLQSSNVTVPGVDSNSEMTYEVTGLNSISSLNSDLQKYMTNDVISRLKNSPSGDITKYLHDYNGKVYFAIGGVGDGSYIKYKNATVVNSEGDTAVVQLVERSAFTDEVEHRINVTLKYDNTSSSYKVTDYKVN